MRTGLLCIFMMICCVSSAQSEKTIEWEDLATIQPEAIETKAKTFLIRELPELKDVEIKLIQMHAGYHTKHGASLEVVFVHANSFKPMEQNKTLGGIDENYGNKFYIEHIFVEFSENGYPIKLSFQEILLGKERESSYQRFLDHYELF